MARRDAINSRPYDRPHEAPATPAHASKPMATRWEMGGAPSREDGDDHHPRLRKSPHGCGRGAADVIASSAGAS